MKIIFLGTPRFAVPSLDILVRNNYDVVSVVTAPDKPAGRGQSLQMSDVKKYALEKNITVLQPIKFNDPDFLNELRSLHADLQIVVAFRMLPESVWSMPSKGTFNLHGSLLPQYRGAAPINRAIMNGEKETGVTTFFLQQEIDTGKIIFQETIAIGPDESAGELHDRMMMIGAELVLKTVQALEKGNVVETPQSSLISPGLKLKEAPKIFKDDCRLNFSLSVNQLHDQVRGLSPFPGAFFEIRQEDGTVFPVKVFKSVKELAGTVLSHEIITDGKTGIKVSCADGFLHLMELQLPNKKRMSAADLLRGFQFNNNWEVL